MASRRIALARRRRAPSPRASRARARRSAPGAPRRTGACAPPVACDAWSERRRTCPSCRCPCVGADPLAAEDHAGRFLEAPAAVIAAAVVGTARPPARWWKRPSGTLSLTSRIGVCRRGPDSAARGARCISLALRGDCGERPSRSSLVPTRRRRSGCPRGGRGAWAGWMDVAAAATLSVELGALARVHRLPSRAGGASRAHGLGVSRMHLRRTGTPTSVAAGCGARFGALGDAIRLDAVNARRCDRCGTIAGLRPGAYRSAARGASSG